MEIQTDNPQEGYPFPCFSFDDNRCIALNTAYVMSSNTIDIRYVLAVLNSSIGGFLAKLYVTQLQERQFRMLAQYVSQFPIPKASDSVMRELSSLVDGRLKDNSQNMEMQINNVVSQAYKLSETEYSYIKSIESLS